MRTWFTSGAVLAITSILNLSAAEGVAEIVRIPAPGTLKCINAKTDELTVSLRRIITQKTSGMLTTDKKAGITVIATLNSDGNPTAKHPSVNLVEIKDGPQGQVILPLEYPIASLLALSSDSGKSYTKNILLELYLVKVRGANTFGKVLDVAGSLLAKLPIPANPYTNAASEVLKFANDTVTNESKDAGGELFATITLQFNNKTVADTKDCGDFQSTGAIAVIGSKANKSEPPLPLGNLQQKYCWRYSSFNTYEVQYAEKQGDCAKVLDNAFREVPNDYVMLLVSAAAIEKNDRGLDFTKGGVPRRFSDLGESKKLCDAMKISPEMCGVR